MARRIDDIDPRTLPFHRRGLGQNGNPALALQIIAVHRPLADSLIVPEKTRLFEQFIHQSGLAMINVRDDRDIANIHCTECL